MEELKVNVCVYATLCNISRVVWTQLLAYRYNVVNSEITDRQTDILFDAY